MAAGFVKPAEPVEDNNWIYVHPSDCAAATSPELVSVDEPTQLHNYAMRVPPGFGQTTVATVATVQGE